MHVCAWPVAPLVRRMPSPELHPPRSSKRLGACCPAALRADDHGVSYCTTSDRRGWKVSSHSPVWLSSMASLVAACQDDFCTFRLAALVLGIVCVALSGHRRNDVGDSRCVDTTNTEWVCGFFKPHLLAVGRETRWAVRPPGHEALDASAAVAASPVLAICRRHLVARDNHAARKCVLRNLARDLAWWRSRKTCQATRVPDVDGTLCRVRMAGPRSVLTNMMLVRSVNGKLYAKILLDPADDRGPMRHWPGRTIAALQQLAAVQHQIDEGKLPPLPDFTAILNPHDSPQQFSRMNWCGFVPLLSNSRVSVENRDCMMPDFSFAPFGYLTNMIDANMSRAAAVPRGWPKEREAIYRSGRRLPWEQKQRDLFWRGGETHVQRRVYSAAIETGNVTMPTGIPADVILCGAHCSVSVGIPPEAWCSHKQLLSLPGHSFAVDSNTLCCVHLSWSVGHTQECRARRR